MAIFALLSACGTEYLPIFVDLRASLPAGIAMVAVLCDSYVIHTPDMRARGRGAMSRRENPAVCFLTTKYNKGASKSTAMPSIVVSST